MDENQFQFEWDEAKANLRKHGVSFELASSIFADPQLLALADTTHSESEETLVLDWIGEQWGAGRLPSRTTSHVGAVSLAATFTVPSLGLSQLLTDVLKRDIEINEALK